ncbi:hypothetical protein CPB86DRAFT_689020, partial [Serendipita vermifera]
LSMYSLASTLSDRGQLEEAEKMMREVLEVLKEILGPHYPHIISKIKSLPEILRQCGHLEEAEKVEQD